MTAIPTSLLNATLAVAKQLVSRTLLEVYRDDQEAAAGILARVDAGAHFSLGIATAPTGLLEVSVALVETDGTVLPLASVMTDSPEIN